MKRLLLIAAALFALPLAANAGPRPGLRIQPVRSQIVEAAKSAGFLGKGSGEKLQMRTTVKPTMGKLGQVQVTILGTGGMTGRMPNTVSRPRSSRSLRRSKVASPSPSSRAAASSRSACTKPALARALRLASRAPLAQ